MAVAGYTIASIIAVGLLFIGVRFLLQPGAASTAFGVPGIGTCGPNHYLAVKGVRDIATGLTLAVLVAHRSPHLLGWVMLAMVIIPLGDNAVVLRGGGTRAAAYGIHGLTALVTLVGVAALVTA